MPPHSRAALFESSKLGLPSSLFWLFSPASLCQSQAGVSLFLVDAKVAGVTRRFSRLRSTMMGWLERFRDSGYNSVSSVVVADNASLPILVGSSMSSFSPPNSTPALSVTLYSTLSHSPLRLLWANPIKPEEPRLFLKQPSNIFAFPGHIPSLMRLNSHSTQLPFRRELLYRSGVNPGVWELRYGTKRGRSDWSEWRKGILGMRTVGSWKETGALIARIHYSLPPVPCSLLLLSLPAAPD